MSNEEDIRIIETINEAIGIQISKESPVELDSIMFINMVVLLETKYDFEFDDNMLLMSKYKTYEMLIDYVKMKELERDEIEKSKRYL